jgi:hypothetical protein
MRFLEVSLFLAVRNKVLGKNTPARILFLLVISRRNLSEPIPLHVFLLGAFYLATNSPKIWVP